MTMSIGAGNPGGSGPAVYATAADPDSSRPGQPAKPPSDPDRCAACGWPSGGSRVCISCIREQHVRLRAALFCWRTAERRRRALEGLAEPDAAEKDWGPVE